MGYSREVYNRAVAVLADRRRQAEAEAAERRTRILREHPEAAEWERQMQASAGKIARLILSGGDITEALRQVEAENLQTQEKLAALLKECGEPAANFAPVYHCEQCGDTGYREQEMCSCLKTLLADFAVQNLSRLSGMKLTSLDDMDLSFYGDAVQPEIGTSPREHMADVLEYCRCYGENFDGNADSLLLFGTTGTGKTHASLAIARMVTEKGFSVLYVSAGQIFHQLEKEHFGRSDEDSESILVGCDLLILDDLGTEMTTAFTSSCLYNIINQRVLAERPTIISTNLTAADWPARYGSALTSRVLGTFQPLLFVGADIRQTKMERRLRD